MKERYLGHELDVIRLFMTSAPTCGRSSKQSNYPPVAKDSFRQFVPGQKSNSFRGETLIRVTKSVRKARLAERLDGIRLVLHPYCAFVDTCDGKPVARLSMVHRGIRYGQM